MIDLGSNTSDCIKQGFAKGYEHLHFELIKVSRSSSLKQQDCIQSAS